MSTGTVEALRNLSTFELFCEETQYLAELGNCLLSAVKVRYVVRRFMPTGYVT